jgi:hypothetical protein
MLFQALKASTSIKIGNVVGHLEKPRTKPMFTLVFLQPDRQISGSIFSKVKQPCWLPQVCTAMPPWIASCFHLFYYYLLDEFI